MGGVADILESIAWECDSRSCPHAWHKGTYWWYDDGTYSYDEFTDGDHETVEYDDIPTPEEFIASWDRYGDYVIRTGKDPLDEYILKRTIRRKERWEFRFAKGRTGYHITAARHAGRDVPLGRFPRYIRSYMGLAKRGTLMRDFRGKDGTARFLELFPKPERWNAVHVETDVPRDPEAVRKDLIALAKRCKRREKAWKKRLEQQQLKKTA